MVKKVIMNLDLSKAFSPDSIPLVVLKNCEPKLSYILAELFKKVSEEVLLSRLLEGLSSGPCIKNVGEWSTAKNYCPISLLSVVSKLFEKLVNNRIVDQLQRCGFFADFQYGFRSSQSTADLLSCI